jgi:hypothetical protein
VSDTPEYREASWKQWAMEKAVALCVAGRIVEERLEETAERIYRWSAFPKSGERK